MVGPSVNSATAPSRSYSTETIGAIAEALPWLGPGGVI